MRIHHSKHHNGYVTNLNAAVKKLGEAEAAGDVTAINQCKPIDYKVIIYTIF